LRGRLNHREGDHGGDGGSEEDGVGAHFGGWKGDG
jgi:hypothetical protein